MIRALLTTTALVVVTVNQAAAQKSPCDNAPSEIARADCIQALYAKADTELNLTYEQALAAISDTGVRRLLIASERAWVTEKDAEERLLLIFAGGNHPSEWVYPQLTILTQARTQFLKSQVLPNVLPPPLVDRPAANPQEAVLLASLKSDLRNLVLAEEVFFSDSLAYTSRIGPGGIRFVPTGSNQWPKITAAKAGWTATVGSPTSLRKCTIWVGQIANHSSSAEGAPVCP